jgi:hypothetical protein
MTVYLSDIWETPILPHEFVQAEREGKELGVLRKSMMKGTRNVTGMLGEIVTARMLEAQRIRANRHFDLKFGRLVLDVKSKTHGMDVVIPTQHEATIFAYNTTQRCDAYVFTRINLTTEKAWIVGWMWHDEYFKGARQIKRGDRDPTNGQIAPANAFNRYYAELRPMAELVDTVLRGDTT